MEMEKNGYDATHGGEPKRRPDPGNSCSALICRIDSIAVILRYLQSEAGDVIWSDAGCDDTRETVKMSGFDLLASKQLFRQRPSWRAGG